ncbi:hypothetical protein [Pseudomonas iridis]|uniref:hypothetical protein n=1 Tax=Pseudomonas iridis TaxID=2710587 RepID=UPI0021BECF5E|nr:hypothetical protein [Pseudomonas iridis]MCT8946766.1 hypothetical protein [Pseudomonas iridis]
MLAFIATYLMFALVLECVRRSMSGPLFIRTRLKHLPWKLNYSFAWWRADEYFAAWTVASFVMLVVLTFWIVMGSVIDRRFGWALLVMLWLSSTILSVRHFQLVRKFKANAWWLTLLTALITLVYGLIASAYADSFIVNYTRIDATQFPVAQKTLGMLVLMFLWIYSVTLSINVAVTFGYMFMSELTPNANTSLTRQSLKGQFGNKYKAGRHERRRTTMRWIVWSGLLFTFVSISAAWGFFIAHAREGIQETLVFASFHLHPRDCSIPGSPQGARAALISDGRVVVATPASKGYVFETFKCDMQSTEQLRRHSSERLRLDDYL